MTASVALTARSLRRGDSVRLQRHFYRPDAARSTRDPIQTKSPAGMGMRGDYGAMSARVSSDYRSGGL
jgi:hypothetical protein